MPYQNRVTPRNQIVAIPDRGLLMGNRGCLHNDQEQLIKLYCGVKRWIICLLQFKDQKLPLMKPGIYTPLFFLDEATALAAGHRPCALCRRPRYNEFKAKWIAGNPDRGLDIKCSIDRIDADLHKDRWLEGGGQKTYESSLNKLPDGVIVSVPGDESCYLWWNQRAYLWSAGGYRLKEGRLTSQAVVVHTPMSTVNTLRAGFVPMIHRSVNAETC